jgi:hypothetical protein
MQQFLPKILQLAFGCTLSNMDFTWYRISKTPIFLIFDALIIFLYGSRKMVDRLILSAVDLTIKPHPNE